MRPGRIIGWAGVKPGDAVADIGCHEGYLSMHLAEAVGDAGRVFAVDLRKDRLARLREIAGNREYLNITTVRGATDDPKLPETLLDAVFIVDAYHEMDEYMEILSHVRRSLKPGGRVVILEKLKDHAKDKNRAQQVQSHTLSPGYVKKELEEAGFIVVDEYNDLGHWDHESDKTMWLLVARVPQV
jgi:ubiquinone/menaquinone biosynthesis C-methylase UbiE